MSPTQSPREISLAWGLSQTVVWVSKRAGSTAAR
jgi:hypothetical protein